MLSGLVLGALPRCDNGCFVVDSGLSVGTSKHGSPSRPLNLGASPRLTAFACIVPIDDVLNEVSIYRCWTFNSL